MKATRSSASESVDADHLNLNCWHTGGAHEPEQRRQLREAREADKHAKMKAALAGGWAVRAVGSWGG